MHYRSLLFPGVLITAIASLLIVQSCSNKQDRAGTESNRAGTESNRAGTESDLELGQAGGQAMHDRADLELDRASGQALHYIQGYFATRQKSDLEQYLKYKSIINNRCVSNNRAACNLLLNLQKLEGSMENADEITRIVGR
jgi:hypothetical protein